MIKGIRVQRPNHAQLISNRCCLREQLRDIDPRLAVLGKLPWRTFDLRVSRLDHGKLVVLDDRLGDALVVALNSDEFGSKSFESFQRFLHQISRCC